MLAFAVFSTIVLATTALAGPTPPKSALAAEHSTHSVVEQPAHNVTHKAHHIDERTTPDCDDVPPAGPTCNSGSLQCCNQVQQASSLDFSTLLQGDVYSLLPSTLAGSNTPVGLTCSPILAGALGGIQCNQQTVCCDNAQFSGLIAIGCTPINL